MLLAITALLSFPFVISHKFSKSRITITKNLFSCQIENKKCQQIFLSGNKDFIDEGHSPSTRDIQMWAHIIALITLYCTSKVPNSVNRDTHLQHGYSMHSEKNGACTHYSSTVKEKQQWQNNELIYYIMPHPKSDYKASSSSHAAISQISSSTEVWDIPSIVWSMNKISEGRKYACDLKSYQKLIKDMPYT